LLNLVFRRKDSWLCIKNPYQWVNLLDHFQKCGLGFCFIDFPFPITYPQKNAEERNTNLCRYFLKNIYLEDIGIDYPFLIENRVMWIMRNGEEVARKVVNKLNKLDKKYHFKALLNSITFDYTDYIIKQYFINQSKPVITYQHGSVWYDKIITNKSDLHDLVASTMLLTYGEGSSYAYSQSNLEKLPKIVSVGSIGLDRLRESEDKNDARKKRSKILYAITGYYQNSWYYGFSPPMSDRLYYLAQLEIVKGLVKLAEDNPSVKVTIKLHPTNYKNIGSDPPWVNDLSDKQNIYLIRQPGFSQIMREHDILIIDCPTTTLLEALTTFKPVFVLTSVISPPSRDINLLKKRRCVVIILMNLLKDLNARLCENP